MLPNKLSKSRAIKRPAWRAAPPPVSLIIQNMGSFISKNNEWGPPRRGSRPAVGLGSGLGLTQTLPFMYLKGPTKLLLVSPAKWISGVLLSLIPGLQGEGASIPNRESARERPVRVPPPSALPSRLAAGGLEL